MDSSWLANWPLAAGAALTLLAIILWQANSRQGSVSPAQIQSSLASAAQARKNGDHEQAIMLYERALSHIEGMCRFKIFLLTRGQIRPLSRLSSRPKRFPIDGSVHLCSITGRRYIS